MSFWTMIDEAMDDDAADFTIGRMDTGRNVNEIVEGRELDTLTLKQRTRAGFSESVANLPKDKVAVAYGRCKACGSKTQQLGNGICVKCWDYVVNNSSASIKIWPDAIQVAEIAKLKNA